MSRPTVNFVCSVEGCNKKAHAKGWCRTHWTRMHLYGRLDKIQGIVKGNCTVEGCDLPIKGKGLCNKHYVMYKKHGRTYKLERKDQKTKHKYYIMWFDRKQTNNLCDEWLDFWKFAEDIGEKPEGNYNLEKIKIDLPYGPDNFEWKEYLRREENETYKDWWARKWKNNKFSDPVRDRGRHLEKKYGITKNQYDEMFWKQNGKCAICGNSETSFDGKTGARKILAVDHCHKSNKVRELLCNRCNQVIGRVNEDVNLLKKMITYLEKHNG